MLLLPISKGAELGWGNPTTVGLLPQLNAR
jgi:hypothetical protein